MFKDIIKIILLFAFFSVAAYVLDRPEIRRIFFNIDEIRYLLKGKGDRSWYLISVVIFISAGTGLIALGVPRLWVTLIGGGIYGALMGSIISLLSSLLGTSIVYLAGRTLLASILERRLKNRFKEWRVRFQQDAFWWVLYGRLFPFSNSTLMSLICGSCRAPYLPFIWGSLIGFIPLTMVFAMYGSGGAKANHLQIIFATILLILSVFSRRFMKKGVQI